MPLLFSYGTLRDETVQLSTFGRSLEGRPDQLVGFEASVITIAEPGFAAEPGDGRFAIVRFTGNDHHRVHGVAFEVTGEELARADDYEPEEYERISTTLVSGEKAWVYAAPIG